MVSKLSSSCGPRGRYGPRLVRGAAAVFAIGVVASVQLSLAGTAAATTSFACPGGAYNLCIPPQGANEGVTGMPGDLVHAGYVFTVPGSGTTEVEVTSGYEQLTVTCASGSTPAQTSVKVPMPDATYNSPFPNSNGWVPTGDQSNHASYEGSLALPDLCAGGQMDIGQPGQMMFTAQVSANGTGSLNFRSHYNDHLYARSGSWSATKSVTPGPLSCVTGSVTLTTGLVS